MDLSDVGRCLRRWQSDRLFDPIEYEADHLLFSVEVSIALFKFLFGDGFLPIDMTSHLRLGEHRVDPMNGSAPDTQDVTAIFGFRRCIAEIIDIDLKEFGRRLSPGSKRHVLNLHLRLQQVWWQFNVGIHQVLGDVSC